MRVLIVITPRYTMPIPLIYDLGGEHQLVIAGSFSDLQTGPERTRTHQDSTEAPVILTQAPAQALYQCLHEWFRRRPARA